MTQNYVRVVFDARWLKGYLDRGGEDLTDFAGTLRLKVSKVTLPMSLLAQVTTCAFNEAPRLLGDRGGLPYFIDAVNDHGCTVVPTAETARAVRAARTVVEQHMHALAIRTHPATT
jgi:hypothetical protein